MRDPVLRRESKPFAIWAHAASASTSCEVSLVRFIDEEVEDAVIGRHVEGMSAHGTEQAYSMHPRCIGIVYHMAWSDAREMVHAARVLVPPQILSSGSASLLHAALEALVPQLS